jgi:hypothetical protein
MANKTRVLILGGGFALAHTQTGTRPAPWNREQLSVPNKVDNRIAA